ncbi:MAG: mannitol dehydrogenase family protein [SAR324 cluster bacterium]|nr:mannitol dehydrogenase family protein [SAR324 cluster bacterium]
MHPDSKKMTRLLNSESLVHLSTEVSIPNYDRQHIKHGIVHIGVGGFHRAHQALYTDDLFQNHGITSWGICGVGLLPQDKQMEKALRKQDFLYTLIERHYDQEKARVIGSLIDYLYAPENPGAVLEKMVSEDTKIVSLTITEGGYCYNEGTGEFDSSHPYVKHDLENPQHPIGVFGFLVEALHQRCKKGVPPFTILSCDNLQSNGDLTKKMVISFAQLRDCSLSQWISKQVTFPNCMVDRITPMTTDEDKSVVLEKWGIQDEWPVIAESFNQWVIEDRFCNGRPPWDLVGVQMTGDVLPYEKMKIRLLNASHSAATYLAYLDGYDYFYKAISDPLYREYLGRMMNEEITPLLPAVPGIDLTEYKKTLLERFGNPSVKDHLNRICMDGSSKMPKFILPSIQEHLQQGNTPRLLSLAVAGWFRFLSAENEKGETIPINDPMAEILVEKAKAGKEHPSSLLGITEIFGELLPNSQSFVDSLTRDLESLYQKGARATLQEALNQ